MIDVISPSRGFPTPRSAGCTHRNRLGAYDHVLPSFATPRPFGRCLATPAAHNSIPNPGNFHSSPITDIPSTMNRSPGCDVSPVSDSVYDFDIDALALSIRTAVVDGDLTSNVFPPSPADETLDLLSQSLRSITFSPVPTPPSTGMGLKIPHLLGNNDSFRFPKLPPLRVADISSPIHRVHPGVTPPPTRALDSSPMGSARQKKQCTDCVAKQWVEKMASTMGEEISDITKSILRNELYKPEYRELTPPPVSDSAKIRVPSVIRTLERNWKSRGSPEPVVTTDRGHTIPHPVDNAIKPSSAQIARSNSLSELQFPTSQDVKLPTKIASETPDEPAVTIDPGISVGSGAFEVVETVPTGSPAHSRPALASFGGSNDSLSRSYSLTMYNTTGNRRFAVGLTSPDEWSGRGKATTPPHCLNIPKDPVALCYRGGSRTRGWSASPYPDLPPLQRTFERRSSPHAHPNRLERRDTSFGDFGTIPMSPFGGPDSQPLPFNFDPDIIHADEGSQHLGCGTITILRQLKRKIAGTKGVKEGRKSRHALHIEDDIGLPPSPMI